MKKNILLSIALSISCLIANAQAPEKINYQAVARDLSGTPLVNQSLLFFRYDKALQQELRFIQKLMLVLVQTSLDYLLLKLVEEFHQQEHLPE